MKKKSKLIATLSSLGLALAMMVFAVYAATSVTFKVTTNVSFQATKHVQATIVAKDTGKLASAPTDASYTVPAKTGAEQTIGVKTDGTDNGSITDVEFVGAQLDATNKYYGYQITITNNDDENKLPVKVRIPAQAGEGYTVTYAINGVNVNSGVTEAEILEDKDSQNNVYVITCTMVITDLAGNKVEVNNADMELDIYLGDVELPPEPTLEYLMFYLSEDGDEKFYGVQLPSIDGWIDAEGADIVVPSEYYDEDQSSEVLPVKELISAYGVHPVTFNSIVLPDTIEIINSFAISGSQIRELKLPNKLKSIRYKALCNNNNLTTIVIPESVMSIEELAFSNCSNLTIFCEVESKPEGWDSNWNSLNGEYTTKIPVYWAGEWELVDGVPQPK